MDGGYLTAEKSRNATRLANMRLDAQATYQNSNGSNALTGSGFSTSSGGVKADVIVGPAITKLACTQTGRGGAYRTP